MKAGRDFITVENSVRGNAPDEHSGAGRTGGRESGVAADGLDAALALLRDASSTAIEDSAFLGFQEASDFAGTVEELSRAVDYLHLVAAGAVDRTRKQAVVSAAKANTSWTTGWRDDSSYGTPATSDSASGAVAPNTGTAAAAGSAADPSAAVAVDDGYRNTALNGRLVYEIAKGHQIGATVLEAKSRNHYDRGGPTVDAFNNDKTRAHGVFLRNRFSDIWTSELRWGSSEDWSENFAPGRSLFATTQTQWTWQNDLRLPVGKLLVALENTEQAVDSTTNYTVKRREVDSAVLGYQGNVGAHSWQAALRRDDNSQFGAHTTGSLGYGYRFATEWQARAAIGTAFKAPSFNQLYFPGFGNANLKPEKARNREIGLHWQQGGQRASVTVFDNRIEDLIAGFPVTNIGKARITGTSLAYGAAYGAWSVDAGLDLMKPINEATGNRLQRRPAEMLKLAVTYAPDDWKIGGEINAVGRRYDTTTEGRPMHGYTVANLFASKALDKEWSLEGRINNLFDRVYETAWAYAVPGRELFVGLRYQPK